MHSFMFSALSNDADELLEAGATEITLPLNGPNYDMSLVKEWIAWRDTKE